MRSVLSLAIGCFLIAADIAALAQSPPGTLSPKDFDLACVVAAGAEMGASQNEQNIPRRDMAVRIFIFYLGRLSVRDDSKDWNAIAWGRVAELQQSSPTLAQQISQTSVPPAPTHKSVTIVIGNKFREALNASRTALRMLRIGNNNTNDDSCWVFVGSGRASKEGSYEVSARQGISPLPAVCAIRRDPGNLCVEFRHSRCRISIGNIARRIFGTALHDEKISPFRKFLHIGAPRNVLIWALHSRIAGS